MADNRPPRRDEEIMIDEEGCSGGPAKAALPPGPERNPDEEVIIDEIPTRRAVRSHNPEGKWYYLN